MSRRIASRLKVKGTLTAHGPFHVGGVGGNEDVDLMIALDGQNRPYVPGTSIAGPLRAWLSQRTSEETVNGLFGPPQEKGSANKGHASFVIVEDGLVTRNGAVIEGSATETRDGVGIDRRWGAAADGAKYNRAVLPNGSQISFEMTVEIAAGTHDESDRDSHERSETIRSLIGAMLQALRRGEVRFGAAKSRGHGYVKLDDTVRVSEQTLLKPEGMLQALRKGGKSLGISGLKPEDAPVSYPSKVAVGIAWRPRGALMVKAERDGVAVDMLPLTGAIDDKLTFVLPGSSIKGALRAQAERIVRTVCPAIETNEKFHEHIALPLVSQLFGAAPKSTGKDEEWSDDDSPLPGLSAVSVEDSYATKKVRFDSDQWQAVEQAEDSGRLLRALEAAGLAAPNRETPELQQAFHVAVDRWTGGAADGFLYSVLEPHGVEWEPIHLSLDLTRLRKDDDRNDRDPAVALLLLVLRDLTAERIPLGFGVNRGMGAIEVSAITVTPEGLNDDDTLSCLANVRIENGRINGFSDTLNSVWAEWIKRENTTRPATGEQA